MQRFFWFKPTAGHCLTLAGWRNYSLFLGADGLLIGYLECDDFDAVRARMALTDVNARWQDEMPRLFDNPGNPGQAPDEGFQVLEEVFNLDDQLAGAESTALSGIPLIDLAERRPQP